MIFRETSLFTKQVIAKLTDAEYLELQAALMLQPDLGDHSGYGGTPKDPLG